MAQYYENVLKNNGLSDKLDQEKVVVGWPWRLFIFSFLVMLASIVIYFGLTFGYQPLLQSRIDQADKDIGQLSQSIPSDQQDHLVKFYSQLANLQNILGKHVFGSAIFPILERNINQALYYNSAELKISDRRLSLDGVASSYQVISQQLEAFNRLPDVQKVIVNESYSENGRVNFRLSVILDEKVFRR